MPIEVQNLTVYPKNPRAGYTVILQVTGLAAEVHAWVENYMREYPPQGYGTWVVTRVEQPEGQVRATVRRSDSCD